MKIYLIAIKRSFPTDDGKTEEILALGPIVHTTSEGVNEEVSRIRNANFEPVIFEVEATQLQLDSNGSNSGS